MAIVSSGDNMILLSNFTLIVCMCAPGFVHMSADPYGDWKRVWDFLNLEL